MPQRRPGRPRKYKRLAERAVELSPEAYRGLIGIILLILGGIFLLAFIGIAGSFGVAIHSFLRELFGWTSYLLPIFLVLFGWFLLRPPKEEGEANIRLSTVVGFILFYISLPGFIHIFMPQESSLAIAKDGVGGGLVGHGIASIFLHYFDFWASLFILLGMILISLIMVTNTSLGQIWGFVKSSFGGEREEGEAVRINSEKEEGHGGLWAWFLNLFHGGGEAEVAPPPKPSPVSNWVMPDIDLLEDKINKPSSGNIEKNIKTIKKTLLDFNMEVTMGDVNIGPTVTQFTLKPTTGVKLNQITARTNDLSLALAAHPIRVEAPIPGRSAVGVEVPNKVPALVHLREMLLTKEYTNLHSSLSFMLGRDVAGIPIGADLEKMPHLLIAGSTGSGKSICINNLILTLLYRNTPDELKFLMVDPKRVELVPYNNVPHLLAPVVTDVDKTISSLRWAVAEMERRYKVLQESNKRNIDAYNMAAKEKIPYIIIIIDELSKLMAAAPREIEGSIVRIAQMARAVGIHLVVATQRPSVDVITGLIKANITSRIAFAVASQVDSRTILDMSGAEKLLGNGDMLYLASDTGKPKRIQGVFVSDREIKAVTGFLKKEAPAQYDEEILTFRPEHGSIYGGVEGGTPYDEMYDDAVEVVCAAGKASASLLQRRLRIGYARAARLLDLLEEKGVVGPAEGAKPRDVLIDNDGGRYKFEDH